MNWEERAIQMFRAEHPELVALWEAEAKMKYRDYKPSGITQSIAGSLLGGSQAMNSLFR